MRNFELVVGTYQMTLTEDQWDSVEKALLCENDDPVIDFDESLDPAIVKWGMECRPYLVLVIEPECEDDVPGILDDFEQKFVETFGG